VRGRGRTGERSEASEGGKGGESGMIMNGSIVLVAATLALPRLCRLKNFKKIKNF